MGRDGREFEDKSAMRLLQISQLQIPNLPPLRVPVSLHPSFLRYVSSRPVSGVTDVLPALRYAEC